ncbi:MAG: hypothetical protein AAF465_12585 [Pseudomonadota bacterium]
MSDFNSGAVRRFIDDSAASVIFDDSPSQGAPANDLRVRKVELVVRCQELARFLRGFDETHWAVWLDECVTAIRKDSRIGAEELLEGYSGIGSISDVYLCPEAGHRLDARDEVAINEQYLLMLSKVNNLAREIALW